MIGSARLFRSYGLTHGLIGAQPPANVESINRITMVRFMDKCSESEKQCQTAGEFEVVQRLVGAQQVRLEYVVAHIDAQR